MLKRRLQIDSMVVISDRYQSILLPAIGDCLQYVGLIKKEYEGIFFLKFL